MRLTKQTYLQNFSRWTFLSVLCGILAGCAASLFLWVLLWATQFRESHPALLWGLPIAGFLIGWVYHVYGQDISSGNNLILDEIHDPQKVTPIRLSPMILFSTVLTHLVGGSSGREGTAVQMGASLSDQLARIFHIQPQERKILLMIGAGAGFGAAIGTPWAGAIFGLEVIRAGKIKFHACYEALLASATAFFVTKILQAPHSQFLPVEIEFFNLKNFFYVLLAALFFGLTARLFMVFTHGLEKIYTRFVSYSPLKPVIGGILLLGFYHLEGSFRFVGLGLDEIQKSLIETANLGDPIYKIFFTALTIASGFKGGEFIPLVFIGSTLGSALSAFLGAPLALLARVGFAAVFGAAAKTPLACTIMAAELFGWHIGIYALVGCYISFFISGRKSIYKPTRLKS